jgi:hypothetical protein
MKRSISPGSSSCLFSVHKRLSALRATVRANCNCADGACLGQNEVIIVAQQSFSRSISCSQRMVMSSGIDWDSRPDSCRSGYVVITTINSR